MVNHYPNSWWDGEKKNHCQPGQTVTSVESIMKKAGKGITRQKVRTTLALFEKLGFLTMETTKRNTVVTLTNWALYQGNNEKLTNDLTTEQPSANHQLTTKKECKNEKMKEKDLPSKGKINKPQAWMTRREQIAAGLIKE